MMFKIFCVFVLLLTALPAAAQVDDCGVVSGDVATHLRLRAERIEKLEAWRVLLAEDGISDESTNELMRWAVLADNAMFKSREVIYPDCEIYQHLDSTYKEVIAQAYAISVQLAMMNSGVITSSQQLDMLKVMGQRETALVSALELWQSLYEALP